MAGAADERFAFVAEWYDTTAALVRRYELLFYPKDNSVEMVDTKAKKSFLRRCKVETPVLADLYVGSTVVVYGRQLQIVEYADPFTRKFLGSAKEKGFALVKREGMQKLGDLVDVIQANGLLITRMKMIGGEVAMELIGDSATAKLQQLTAGGGVGDAPQSIRSRFGADLLYCSASPEMAGQELEKFFPSQGPPRPNGATFQDATLCIVRPHAVQAGLLGRILATIQEANFEISALQMFQIPKANAEEFLEVYKGVVHEYMDMVTELISGPCVALEIRSKDAHSSFREFAGPYDPEIARQLRPRTLRALFGQSKVKNAVHCTDLPEDTQLELEYFFRILDR